MKTSAILEILMGLQAYRIRETRVKLDLREQETGNKKYFDELEERVEFLEKENLRLHNLLDKQKIEDWKEIDQDADFITIFKQIVADVIKLATEAKDLSNEKEINEKFGEIRSQLKSFHHTR